MQLCVCVYKLCISMYTDHGWLHAKHKLFNSRYIILGITKSCTNHSCNLHNYTMCMHSGSAVQCNIYSSAVHVLMLTIGLHANAALLSLEGRVVYMRQLLPRQGFLN